MSKKNKRSAKTMAPTDAPGAGFGGLGALLAAEGLSPSAPSTQPASASPTPNLAMGKATSGSLTGKAVVRRERKGRGGKTVTVVDGKALAAQDLQALAKRLRKALGAGARVEDSRLVVQGDQRDAAKRWLEKQGATVVLGN